MHYALVIRYVAKLHYKTAPTINSDKNCTNAAKNDSMSVTFIIISIIII